MKTIRSYTDYRRFLLDHVEELRTASTRWSLGVWARKLGLSQTGSISMILSGRRHPGPKLVEQFNKYFSFSHDDARYFNLLVSAQKAKDPTVARLLTEVVSDYRRPSKHRQLSAKEFSNISRWYFYLIREMTRLQGFHPTAVWIRERMRKKLSLGEIDLVLHKLLSDRFLSLKPNGRLLPDPEPLITTSDVASAAIRQGHREFINLALDALDKVAVDQREFVASTICIRRADLPRIKETIRDFQDILASRFEACEAGDSVFQINMQVFPLTN